MNAAEVLAAASVVLLDFDGPITPLMPPPANAQAADAARAALLGAGVALGQQIEATTDHLAVLRWTGTHAPSALPTVEHACDAAEVRAALVSVPTPGAHDFLTACNSTRRPVVIVSNNTAAAINAYLDQWDLTPLVHAVIGRPAGQPDLMKPHPHAITTALRIVATAPTDAVLIGDSVSDVQVAHTTGVRSIGYAKTPARGHELARAGVDTLVEHISDLTALRS